MKEQKQYEHFLKKLLERLTMIFNYHLPNGKPIIESDRELLHVLYRVYYNGDLDKLAREKLAVPEPQQKDIFETANTTDLFTKAGDSVKEQPQKANGKVVDNK